MAAPSTIVFVLDASSELGHAAATSAVLRWGNSLLLSPWPLPPTLRVGVAGLVQQAGTLKTQVRVVLRPSRLSLRDLHAAVAKLARPTAHIDSVAAAGALGSLIGAVAADTVPTSCADPSAPSSPLYPHTTLVLLSDHLHDAQDFLPLLESSRGRGVALQAVAICCGDAGLDDPELASSLPGWAVLEARYPDSLGLTVAEGADDLPLNTLTAAALARGGVPPPLEPVHLAFKLPLIGEVGAGAGQW